MLLRGLISDQHNRSGSAARFSKHWRGLANAKSSKKAQNPSQSRASPPLEGGGYCSLFFPSNSPLTQRHRPSSRIRCSRDSHTHNDTSYILLTSLVTTDTVGSRHQGWRTHPITGPTITNSFLRPFSSTSTPLQFQSSLPTCSLKHTG